MAVAKKIVNSRKFELTGRTGLYILICANNIVCIVLALPVCCQWFLATRQETEEKNIFAKVRPIKILLNSCVKREREREKPIMAFLTCVRI